MKRGELSKKVRFYVAKGMSDYEIAALFPDASQKTVSEYARKRRRELGLPNPRGVKGPAIKMPESIYAPIRQEAEARGIRPYDLVRGLLAAVVAQNKIADLIDAKGG